MNKKRTFYINGKPYEKRIKYIPVRYSVAITISLAETLAVIATAIFLCMSFAYSYIAVVITQITVVVHIIASNENPDFKIPWLLFVLILPVVGFMLYFMFAKRRLDRKLIKRLKELRGITYEQEDEKNFATLSDENLSATRSATLLCSTADAHLFRNTDVTYLPSGEVYKDRLIEDLQHAEKFIFMEYFIIEEGVFWDSILEILKEKVKNGVEVRVLYDDIGCMMKLPGNYVKTLRSYGIKATVFSRLRGSADSEFNNRTHRKITVIDGKIGYTGGINLADEYINEVAIYGHWKDCGVRLYGEAVKELTKLFLINYGMNIKKPLPVTPDYFPSTEQLQSDDGGYLVPFGDGPNPIYPRQISKIIIQNLIENAKNYVYITTPYLIIDNELCTTIENAALRGVKVKIIVPHIPDKKIIFAMTKSNYHRFISAGVEIYEYTPGFIHAKTYIADDEYGIVGTINLDYRSLVHHFENGVWLYKKDCIRDIKNDIEDTLSKSERITADKVKIGFAQSCFNSIVKLFSPLL